MKFNEFYCFFAANLRHERVKPCLKKKVKDPQLIPGKLKFKELRNQTSDYKRIRN